MPCHVVSYTHHKKACYNASVIVPSAFVVSYTHHKKACYNAVDDVITGDEFHTHTTKKHAIICKKSSVAECCFIHTPQKSML